MRLLFLWLALVSLSRAQDDEVTTPLTTPTATEVSAQDTVAEVDESTSEGETTEGEEEIVVTTEIIEAVTESLSEETTNAPGEEETTDGGEVVIEAEDEEDEEEEEEEVYVVKSASYTMSTDATLGLEIDITLEHLSNDNVRMVCEMEEKEETTEEVGESETTLTPAAEETTEIGATEAPEGESEDTTDIVESVTEAVTESFRDSITGGTIYIIADTVACNDLTTAIAEGYTVEALPLADVTGVGDAIGFLDVEWADIKKGSCLAILKEAADATTLPPEEETTTETGEEERRVLPRKKRMFSSNVLRTEGLPRVFTAINLATFSVLSVGVTGAFAAAAVVSQASSSSSSSSSSSNGSSITFWSANEQLIYGTLGVLGLFAFAYFFSRRDLFRQRMATVTQRLGQISPQYRARIADRLDAFEDGMVDVVQRLGLGLTGIQWRNGQSRVANIASFASRVGSAVVEPYINYYKNLLPSTKYRRNLGSKIRRIDEWLKDTFNSDPGVYEAYPGTNQAYW